MATRKGIFGAAKKVDPATLKPKTDGARKVQTDGLLPYASICAVAEALDGLKTLYRDQLDSQMADEFLTDGCNIKHRPKNYSGVDGVAEASMQLRKKSSRSKLTADQIARLKKAGVKLEIKERYVFNNDLLSEEVLALLEKATSKVSGIPEGLVELVEDVSIPDEALNQIFQHPQKETRELMDIVTTLAMRPKVKEDFADTVARVGEIVNAQHEREEASVQ